MSEPGLVELLQVALSWIEPPFVRSRISFCLADAYRAIERLSRSDVTEDEVERVAMALYEQGIVEREIAPAVARAAIAAMRSAQQDGGWRTIESAPKDGTRVIVFDPTLRGEGAILASYDCDCWGDCAAEGFPVHPTHWMPLPEPPAQQATSADNPSPRQSGSS